MAIVAGQKIRASDLNTIGVVVARNRRTTNTPAVTAATRVLSVIAPVTSGRTYRVLCHGEAFAASVPTTSQLELRYTTNNVEPTTTAPVLARALVNHEVTAVPDTFTIVGEYLSSTTGTLRVVLCTTRVVGTSTVTVVGDPAFPTHLSVEDVGPTVATTGTVY
jgi:hypothetical protein